MRIEGWDEDRNKERERGRSDAVWLEEGSPKTPPTGEGERERERERGCGAISALEQTLQGSQTEFDATASIGLDWAPGLCAQKSTG